MRPIPAGERGITRVVRIACSTALVRISVSLTSRSRNGQAVASADLVASATKAIAGITVNQETIDDAVAAVELLRKTKDIDPNRITPDAHAHRLG